MQFGPLRIRAESRLRHLGFTVAALATGLLTSAASGWLGTWRLQSVARADWSGERTSGYSLGSDGRAWQWAQHRAAGATWWQWIHLPQLDSGAPVPDAADFERLLRARYGAPQDGPAFAETMSEVPVVTRFAVINRHDVGWPFRSFSFLQAEFVRNPHIAGARVFRGIDADSPALPDWLPPIVRAATWGGAWAPTTPVWPGFGLNWAFWSLTAVAIVAVPCWVRARLRGQKGLCSRCGYDRRGLPGIHCPECGGRVGQEPTTGAQSTPLRIPVLNRRIDIRVQ